MHILKFLKVMNKNLEKYHNLLSLYDITESELSYILKKADSEILDFDIDLDGIQI
ncbi:MAG TPA: hypothetical protein PLD95_04130 [bacterium]|nr:hypothetical protein [bacterium]HOG38631.1 hypothetical protein [bacterium]HQI03453.1 hypothetical protein [bacterium]